MKVRRQFEKARERETEGESELSKLNLSERNKSPISLQKLQGTLNLW